jgi:hypothetical protein
MTNTSGMNRRQPYQRRHPIYAADIRSLGGVVSIVAGRDRFGGDPIFHISHVSRGGEIAWKSQPIHDEDRAMEAARILAEFTGATVVAR